MNSNGNRAKVDHAIRIASDPANRNIYQQEFNAQRMKLVESSLLTRPVWIPLQFTMNAAGQTAPYRQTTQTQPWDVVIFAIKTDTQTRDVVLRYTDTEQSLLRTGGNQDLLLRVDDIAGLTTTAGGGQQGAFHLPSPIMLEEGSRFSVEMYKTDTTGDVEVANITLIGFRVLRKPVADSALGANQGSLVARYISQRPLPQTRFLKIEVDFDSAIVGGIATDLYTPSVDEPLLLRGIRTNLRHSTIEFGFEGEDLWTTQATPIWAVAGEDEGTENYQWFAKPIFVPVNRQIYIRRITNGDVDDSNIDGQSDNFLTFLCDTV